MCRFGFVPILVGCVICFVVGSERAAAQSANEAVPLPPVVVETTADPAATSKKNVNKKKASTRTAATKAKPVAKSKKSAKKKEVAQNAVPPPSGDEALDTDDASLDLSGLDLPAGTTMTSAGPTLGYKAFTSGTALRVSTPIMETPLSVHVVPQELLDDQNAYRVQDVVKNVPGVQFQKNSNNYENYLSRGFEAPVFRDGTRTFFHQLPLAATERIEVLKGPAAVQYGRIEPGGMINAVSKRPQQTTHASVKQDFGSFDHYRTEVDLGGALTQDKSLQFRIVGEHLDENSFIDYGYREREFIAPSLLWKPFAGTTILVQYEHRDEKLNDIPGIPAIGNRPAPVPISRFYGEPGLGNHWKSDGIYVSLNQKITDEIEMRAGYSQYWGDYEYTGVAYHALEPDGRTLRRTFVLDSEFDKRNSKDAYVDVQAKFNVLGMEHKILLGTDYHWHGGPSNWFTFDAPPTDLYNPTYGTFDHADLENGAPTDFFVTTNRWNGLYLQDQIKLGRQWHILLGGRWDWAKNSSGYAGTSLADARSQLSENEQKAHEFSPNVGIVYQPVPGLSVYGSYSESFGAANGRTSTGEVLPPEQGRQYEVGVKSEFFGGALTATVAVFDILKSNVKTPDLSTPDPNDSTLVDGAQSRGIEVEVVGKISSGVHVSANYALIDTEIVEDASGNKGNRFANIPRHSGGVWLSYAFSGDKEKGLSIGGGVYAASDRQGDIENSFILPAYARVDAFAAYKFEVSGLKYTAQLNVENLLDTTYYQAANGRNDIQAGAPLTVIGGLKVAW